MNICMSSLHACAKPNICLQFIYAYIIGSYWANGYSYILHTFSDTMHMQWQPACGLFYRLTMFSLLLKVILISLLATVPAITLDPCSSEAATKPGGLGLYLKNWLCITVYLLAKWFMYLHLVIQRKPVSKCRPPILTRYRNQSFRIALFYAMIMSGRACIRRPYIGLRCLNSLNKAKVCLKCV